MRNTDEIERKLASLIEDISLGIHKADKIKSSQTIMGDLGLDSLDYAAAMLGCEEWLDVKVVESAVDWRQVRTVGDLAELLCRSQKR